MSILGIFFFGAIGFVVAYLIYYIITSSIEDRELDEIVKNNRTSKQNDSYLADLLLSNSLNQK